jgi:DHA1 family multidrug resistance protein-like MFS transporter
VKPIRLSLYVLAFLATLGYGVMIPSLAVYCQSLGGTSSTVGVVVSAFAAAQLLTQVPMGRLSDRIGRVYMVVAGFALMAIAASLYNFAYDPRTFVALQAIAGVGAGCLWPPVLAMLSETTAAAERGRVMGAFNTVFFLGVGLGPLLGGFIASALGHNAVFNVWAAIAAAGAFVCMLTIKDAPRVPRAARGTPSAQMESTPLIRKGYWPTFVAGCMVRSRGGICASFNNALLPLYAVSLFAATPKMIGGLMFIHGLGLAFFNIPGGIMSDRMGRRLPAVLGSLVATAGVIWYAAATEYWALFAAVALAGAGSAFSTPAVAALTADVSDPRRSAEAFGYFLTSFNMGMALGALVFGFVADALGLWGGVVAWGMTSLAFSLVGLIIREPAARTREIPAALDAGPDAAISRRSTL